MNGLKNLNGGEIGRHLHVPRQRQPLHCLIEPPGSVEQASVQGRACPPGEWGLLPPEAPVLTVPRAGRHCSPEAPGAIAVLRSQ